MTVAKFKYSRKWLSSNISECGKDAQEILDRLIKTCHVERDGDNSGRELTPEEEEQFMKDLQAFIAIPNLDFVTKMYFMSKLVLLPKQVNDSINYY